MSKTVKERILNKEEFTFPDAFYAHEWPKRLNKWFHVDRIEDDEDGTLWVRESSILGDSFPVESFGKKYIKFYKFALKRKINFKIALDDIIFKNDHLAKYPDCKYIRH